MSDATPRPWAPHIRQITGMPTHYYGYASRWQTPRTTQSCCEKHEHRGSHTALVCAVKKANTLNMADHDRLQREHEETTRLLHEIEYGNYSSIDKAAERAKEARGEA